MNGEEVSLLSPGDPDPEGDAHGEAHGHGRPQRAERGHAPLHAVLQQTTERTDPIWKKNGKRLEYSVDQL